MEQATQEKRYSGEPRQAKAQLDVARIREDFRALHQTINGNPLVYLDNASTTHKPTVMVDRIRDFYTTDYAKTRSQHALGKRATEAYEQVRAKVAAMLHADDAREIVFTRNATDGINIVAIGFSRGFLGPGDEVLLTSMEHHSNIVPWQIVCRLTGASVKVAPIEASGDLDLDRFKASLSDRTKIVAVAHISNVLGAVYPIKEIVKAAHARDIPVLVDGAQGAPHVPVDVQDLGCDFYALSAHKMYGPGGVGVLFGRARWLEKLTPHQGGSPMAESVTFESAKFKEIPVKFEAGVPAIAETVGFGASLDYLNAIGMDRIRAYEKDLVERAAKRLASIDRVRLVGSPRDRVSVVSFSVEGMKPEKVMSLLDEQGIALRAGDLSAQPLMEFYGLSGAVRASFSFYNTVDEIEVLAKGLERCLR